jgi:hypothetical protein
MNDQGNSARAAAVTLHAAERWTQRVDRGASIHEARLAVQRFIAFGRVRPTARHWMRGRVRQEPGTVFAYNAHRPDVCAVILDGVVVTILTRSLFASRPRHLALTPAAPQATSALERARWRWSRNTADLDEAA